MSDENKETSTELAHLKNMAGSSQVTLPLYELDQMRSELIRINNENVKLKKKEKKVLLELTLYAEEKGHKEIMTGLDWGGRTQYRTELVNMINKKDVVTNYVGLDDIIEEIRKEYRQQALEQEEKLHAEYAEMADKLKQNYEGKREELAERFDPDYIAHLEQEVEDRYEEMLDLEKNAKHYEKQAQIAHADFKECERKLEATGNKMEWIRREVTRRSSNIFLRRFMMPILDMFERPIRSFRTQVINK